MLVGNGFASSAREVCSDCRFLFIISRSSFSRAPFITGAPISGPLIMEKARSFFTKLYPEADAENFKASNGWLTRFKARHGIRNVQLRGEILSADSSVVAPFREELTKVMTDEGYSLDQLFNADETGLWWRMTPMSSLNPSGICSCNFKKAKERVTIMACSNASGSHRLPLVVINKSAKPRCFKQMDMDALPVHYFPQTKSWMDCQIFSKWFHERFIPSVKKFCKEKGIEEKALLLIDNAPSHPSAATLQSADDGKIKAMFLPPNTTAILQPMDQGVLDPCKRRYKRKLLRHIVLENESADESLPDILKKVTLKNVIYWVAEAWQEASNDSLGKAWRNLLLESDPESEAETNSDSEEALAEAAVPLGKEAQETVFEWIAADANDPGYQIMDDEEIVAEVVASDDDEAGGSDEESPAVGSSIIPTAAFDALDTSLRWLESQGTEAEHLLLVKKWRDQAARMRQKSLKQSCITSFFMKS